MVVDPIGAEAAGSEEHEQRRDKIESGAADGGVVQRLSAVACLQHIGDMAHQQWTDAKADPLLFVESIPVYETRSYVKRLMLYHWFYRRRFGEDAPSLDQTARGNWPVYHPSSRTLPVLTASPAAAQPAVAGRPAPVQVTNTQK